MGISVNVSKFNEGVAKPSAWLAQSGVALSRHEELRGLVNTISGLRHVSRIFQAESQSDPNRENVPIAELRDHFDRCDVDIDAVSRLAAVLKDNDLIQIVGQCAVESGASHNLGKEIVALRKSAEAAQHVYYLLRAG